MDMLQLDINQCDDKFNVPNAFKGTHKCDKKSSYVSSLLLLLLFLFLHLLVILLCIPTLLSLSIFLLL